VRYEEAACEIQLMSKMESTGSFSSQPEVCLAFVKALLAFLVLLSAAETVRIE
jgi:hypothetical protein